MSSGTKYEPSPVRRLLDGLASKIMGGMRREDTPAEINDRIKRLGLSPRQQALNRLWGVYRCEQYAGRKFDWDGKPVPDPIEHEAIATQGFIPPGFVDVGASFPIKFRKPTAPYSMVRVVVDRFTGLLFSEKRHPSIHVEGDQDTEDYVAAMLEAARIWPAMIMARQYGGSMGSVCIGFQFNDGKPVVEVHDPRWVEPTFADRFSLRLRRIEKRYMYPVEERDVTGAFHTVWYWYRRIIDEGSDVLFKPAPVGDGDEPDWQEESRVDHKLGFCPIVWVQNLPVQDDIDGDPDCLGIYEMVETIDALLAQANKGILANSDPTVVVTTDMELGAVRKGSDNAVKLEKGGSCNYMEMTGSGPKSALDAAEQFRKYALEVVQCILEHPDMSQRTATEIERAYSAMLAKADVLREQYGQKGILPLVDMMVQAVRKLGEGRITETGEIEKQVLNLPPKVHTGSDGEITTEPHKFGQGGTVTIQWPHYFEPMLSDVELASRSAIAAQAGGLIDQEHAVRFVAEYFRVEEIHGMMEKIAQERTQTQELASQQALSMLRTPGADFGGGSGDYAEGEME